MNAQQHIEDHHDLLTSRAEVFAVEISNEIDLPEDQFDRAVMLDVERRSVHGAGDRTWGVGEYALAS